MDDRDSQVKLIDYLVMRGRKKLTRVHVNKLKTFDDIGYVMARVTIPTLKYLNVIYSSIRYMTYALYGAALTVMLNGFIWQCHILQISIILR